MNVTFTPFPVKLPPPGFPNFHSPENFREYVRLYWWNRCINQIEVLYPGDFAPFPAQSSGVVGQGTINSELIAVGVNPPVVVRQSVRLDNSGQGGY